MTLSNHPSRRYVLPLLTTLALIATGLNVQAQNWPAKPISLVVPFPSGGTTDVLARAVGQELSVALGQPVVVESKPGAGSTLGADYVAKAKPDGHTLLMGAVHHTIASSVYKKLPYDFQKDLAPISIVAMVPNVLVINTAIPAKNVSELLALAKAQPGKYSFGSNGNGTAQHLIGAQFESMGGVELLHVPYKGSGPLTTDLLGGQIQMSFDTITPVLPHIKAGKLRALAVTTGKRSAALPDVPTLDEAGLKGFDLGTWFGLLAPAGTPTPIVERLSQEVARIVARPDFRKKLEDIGANPVGNTSAQMARQIKEDTERYAKLVKDAKVTLE
jgi:tripartite-type tricarboxylate transporter receptor subunit TctC